MNEVGRARTIDIGEHHPRTIEATVFAEIWRIVHGYFPTEAAVAETGPVADLSLGDAHDVRQSVARHVGQKYTRLRIGEDEPWTLLVILRHADPPRGAEAALAEGRVPDQRVVFDNEDV